MANVGFYAIAAKKNAGAPIGSVIICMGDYRINTPIGWLACDGSYKHIAEYSELYQIIGDSVTPKEVKRTERRFFGLVKNTVIEPNPDYRHGMFRLPLMSGGPRIS